MKIRIALVLLIVSFAPKIAFAQPPEKAAEVAPDLTTPEKTVRGFLGALKKDQFSELWKYVLDAKPNQQLPPEYQELSRGSGDQWEMLEINATQQAQWAHVDLIIQFTDVDVNNDVHKINFGSSVLLFKRDDAWQMIPASPQVLGDIGNNFLLQRVTLLVHPETWEPMRQKALAQSSLSNMKQIGLATAQSVQDNDGKILLHAENYPEQLKNYIVNDAIYDLPRVEPKKQYAFNGNLSGVFFKNIKQSAKTVLFYTGQNGELDFIYQDQAAVVFADGHAALVSREETKDLHWKP